MSDLAERLEALRRKVRAIENREPKSAAAPLIDAEPLQGVEIENTHGKHFQIETFYGRHRRYGCVGIADLAGLANNCLAAISENTIPASPPGGWAFLDTETTGLAGGTGIVAFLVGIGRITPDGFRVRQYLMRDHGEEGSLLQAVAEELAACDTLISYNGRTYDVPLLDSRYRLNRMPPPFGSLPHLDLLYGSRRLWKLRFESCRLMQLEHQVLGIEREGDIPGALIPQMYFHYLRDRNAVRMQPVLDHNVLDIVTLACLTAIVPQAFSDPAALEPKHGSELIGLARWLVAAERYDDALALMRRAISMRMPDDLLFRTLWDSSVIEKKRGNRDAALTIWTELATAPHALAAEACTQLAKYYEHSERKTDLALEFTLQARGIADSDELQHRERRLRRALAGPRVRRLI